MLLSEFARVLRLEVRRDGEFATPGLLADPQPRMLVFVESRRAIALLRRTPEVSGVITTVELAMELDDVPALAIADDPRRTLFELHNHLARHTDLYWSDFPTEIHESAEVHPRAFVAASNVRIGPNTVVQPNATILERCILGASVVVHAGAALGGIGFQVSRFPDGVVDMVHGGGVLVRDGAHVLSHAVVAAALFRQLTTLGAGSRIGNHAFVSHNVQVGDRTFVGHGAVINGNVTVGPDAWIGPGAVVSHGLRVGARAQVSLGAVVVKDVKPDQRVSGNFAMDHTRFLRRLAARR